jgi:hypothetical protein
MDGAYERARYAMSYAVWSVVLFVVILLWAAAMSEIGGHLRRGVFSTARLAYMASAVSAAAVVAVAVLPGPEAVPTLAAGGRRDEAGCVVARGPYIVSFGIEQASRQHPDCAAGRT